MSIQRIVVVGAGTMGRGIAEVAATRGLGVTLIEPLDTQRQAAEATLRTSLERARTKGRLGGDAVAEVLGRIRWESRMSAAAEAQFAIEAVSESESLKIDVFRQLESVVGPEVVLASNTSSISITRLAAATKRPGRVVGMHFFNPVPVMAPIEIVRGLNTTDATVNATRELSLLLGKQPFEVGDSPGFAVNRVLMPLINEAAFTLQEGVASAETIDSLLRLGCNHPMGPLQLADLIGLDICLSILHVLQRETGDPKFRPCPLLVRLVDAGHLGRKTGRGFHTYAP